MIGQVYVVYDVIGCMRRVDAAGVGVDHLSV